MLGAQRLGERVRLGGRLGVEDELDDARAVAQVDEDQAAVVAAAVDPAGDADGLADARGVELAGPGVAVGVGARRPHRPSPDVVHHRVGLHRPLLARLHVLERRPLVAEDGNVAGARAVGLLELALQRAPAEFESRRVAGAAGVGGEAEGGRAVLGLGVGDVEVDGRRRDRRRGEASSIRSTPAAQPMPGVGGPPICSISPS